MDKKLVENYLNNQCSNGELDIVLDWFSKSAHTADGEALLYNIWENLSKQEMGVRPDFDIILSKIHHEINLRQTKTFIEESENDLIRYNRRKYLIKIIRNAAAILLIPVLGLGIFYSSKYYFLRAVHSSANMAYNEVFASVDAITKATLPDGSNVWLNHSSSIRYPAVFQGSSRSVELKGEAYFEVSNNPNMPFLVNTGDLQIKAIGTTFNVMAYPEESKIETSLIDGIVEIQKSGEGGKAEVICKMKPTDLAIYNKKSEEIFTKTISDDRYFSWKDGKLIFTAETMEEVIKKLSRWFNVEILIKDPALKDLTFTATFVHETLPQVLELLSISLPVSYSVSDRKETYDGAFSKRKVILSYRSFK